jgi:parallel beta-helix repeat protein
VEEGHIDSSDIKEKPVFLFFYADGCYLCQRQKPIIDELEQEYADKINFIRINGEQNPQMTEEFGVDAFPAMFLIADKNEEGYVYQQFRCFTEKTELRDSTTHALTSGDVRMRSTADDHIRSLSPCPPGSYARNCGGCPCECECYNGTIRKVVEYRSCKLGDVLVKDTTLTKDYTYTGSGRSHQKNFKLDEDGITLDCNGHTLDGAGVGVFDNNRVTIKNCVIVNSDCDGIYLYSSSNNNITGNTVSSNKNQGISLYDSSNNNITGNIASNNIHGIHLSSSSNNVVVNNIANSNGEGIHLWSSSSNNVITGNTASNNIYCGISLYDSSNNNDITSNTASNHSYNGIYLKSSNDNNITDNFASGNVGCGIILLSSSSKNVIFDNAVSNNGDGIGLSSSSNNDLTGNIVSNNDQGIYLDSSDDNTIYNNYFNNTYNAYDDGNNIWNIAKTSGTNIVCGPYLGGNYWSDYAGKDLDDDSLGDTPYNISGGSNKDYLPLVEFIDLWIDNLKIIQTASAANWTVDDSGGADFTGIQEAINKASVGDTIIVHSGVYYENVVVDKSVTLKGIGHPVVDANGSGSAITLSADGITLVGFTATNSASTSTSPATIP